ncbi:MAG: amidohydrolase family protein [Planctomycetota bacterium]|jgi:predicted TIM-barrel fold metal-dependent hydrolase
MFIDIHMHLRRRPGLPRDWDGASYPTPGEMLAMYDRLGIERGVVLPPASPECCRTPQGLEEVLDICGDSGGRLIPFANCDPRFLDNSADAPLEQFLAFYRERGCKGVGEVTANLPFGHPMVRNLFRATQEVGLPLTFHIAPQVGGCYGLVDEAGLPGLEKALADFPNLTFLGHSQPFWAEIGPLEKPEDRAGYPSGAVKSPGRVVELMRRYPNLHGDLSARSGWNALARDDDFAVSFLEEFQDRLYFGTDLTGAAQEVRQVGYFNGLREAKKVSEEVFEKIARGNAMRLLDL